MHYVLVPRQKYGTNLVTKPYGTFERFIHLTQIKFRYITVHRLHLSNMPSYCSLATSLVFSTLRSFGLSGHTFTFLGLNSVLAFPDNNQNASSP